MEEEERETSEELDLVPSNTILDICESKNSGGEEGGHDWLPDKNATQHLQKSFKGPTH